MPSYMYIYYITQISHKKVMFNDIPINEMRKVKIKSIFALTILLSLGISFSIRITDIFFRRKNIFKERNRNKINIRKINV